MKNILLSLAVSFLIGAAPAAHAVEMALSSTDPVVDKAKFSEVVDKFLPEKVKALGPEFKLIGVLETSPRGRIDYMNAPDALGFLVFCFNRIGCSFICGLPQHTLLAPMKSADSLLICRTS